MPTIPVVSTSFESFNNLGVDVGTNCPCGGDSGHGGRTLLRFTDRASTDMSVRVNGGARLQAESVEIVFGGDSECETFIDALEFALNKLKIFVAANRQSRQQETVE